jgi:hypothetical protein
MSIPLRALTLLVAPVLSSAPALAQGLPLWEVDLPGPIPPAERIGRTAAGRLTGDGRPDLVLLAGGDVLIVSAPAIYNVSSHLDPGGTHTFSDVGVLATPGALVDRLFTLSDQGLTEWVFSIATATFVPTVLDSGPASATSLCIADFSGDGADDLACVDASGAGLVLFVANGAGGFEPATTSPIGQPVLELAAVKWAGPTPRIALATDTGRIQIRDTSTTIATFDTGDGHVAFTAFATENQFTEQLAWVTADKSTGEQWLRVVEPQTGVTPILYLGLAGVAPGALERGYVDPDANEDVTMTFATIPNVVTLYNQAASPAFDSQSGITFPYAEYGYDTSIQEAEPRLFDLDNDGDADYALPRQELSDVRLTRNGYTTPETFGLIDYSIDVPSAPQSPGWGPNDGALYVRVSTPLVPSPLATHYEFEAWHLTSSDEVEPQRIGSLAVPIDEEETEAQAWISVNDFYELCEQPGFRPDYYVIVREVGPNHAGTDTIIDLIDVICPSCTSTAQPLPQPIRIPGSQHPVPPPGSPYGSS